MATAQENWASFMGASHKRVIETCGAPDVIKVSQYKVDFSQIGILLLRKIASDFHINQKIYQTFSSDN